MNFNFAKAKKAQEALQSKVVLTPLNLKVRLVAGCDLTFLNPHTTPTTAIGAFVVMRYPSLKVVEVRHACMRVKVPYVPGFLAFRELPLLLQIYRALNFKPDVVVVDGHGIAHPRGLGIASHFSVVAKVPAIGCAKKPLYGRFKEPCQERGCAEPITDPETGKVIGFALRTKTGVKPVYVSPGSFITLEESVSVVKTLSAGFRLPEPTRLAHNFLKELRAKRKVAGDGKIQHRLSLSGG
jgi:deoxyribonuclease V